MSQHEDEHYKSVAIIGMACRFPGANNIAEFWENLKAGVESIAEFSDEELLKENVQKDLLENPEYVKRKGVLNNVEEFDAGFFGYNPEDARLTDPQHRLMLECTWEALENSGYVPDKYSGEINVYAGMADSVYLQKNILKNMFYTQSLDWFNLRMGTSDATLATQLAYRLNTRGSAITVNTACSTALVAVISAYRNLIHFDCDLGIAGAISIDLPQHAGYLYQPGGIVSPDGHCRAFDEQAAGTVFSSGVGVVILKRLEDAKRDKDTIYAVIKGYGLNNDGSHKVGYTAPSMLGQAKCLASAYEFSEVNPDTVGYIEAHGTGTQLGDPIEVHALTQVFSRYTQRKQFCQLSSVKTNIGHTDIASGMAGLIAATLSLYYKKHIPTLHYQKPNPALDIEESPFYINTQLSDWNTDNVPRRAGVSAFGIGGTNAHIVLEECSVESQSSIDSMDEHLIILSAKSRQALNEMVNRHLTFVQNDKAADDITLNAIAYTLQVGRAEFPHRYAFVAANKEEFIDYLNGKSKGLHSTNLSRNGTKEIVFMFPGQGCQYAGMGTALYNMCPYFRQLVNIGCRKTREILDIDLQSLFFGTNNISGQLTADLNLTKYAQPAIFILEYSLAKLLMHWGIEPSAMIGHSLGEYVAACIADVFSYEDAVILICKRAQLMSDELQGTMLLITVTDDELQEFIMPGISVAAINAKDHFVLSGHVADMEVVKEMLTTQGIKYVTFETPHAFHSKMFDKILDGYRHILAEFDFKSPKIPYLSNVTGDWITEGEVTDANYWVRHLRETVKFSDGINKLIKQFDLFIEVGPGHSLQSSVKINAKDVKKVNVVSTLPARKNNIHVKRYFYQALAHMWSNGVILNWSSFNEHCNARRIPLPTYPFQRNRYWVEPDTDNSTEQSTARRPMEKWFYQPTWERKDQFAYTIDVIDQLKDKDSVWVIFMDSCGVGEKIHRIFKKNHISSYCVYRGETFTQEHHKFTLNPANQEEYQQLMANLSMKGHKRLRVIFLWTLRLLESTSSLNNNVDDVLMFTFFSPLYLSQAFINQASDHSMEILMVSNGVQKVLGNEIIIPVNATSIGLCRVIPQECESIKACHVDIVAQDAMHDIKMLALRLISYFDDIDNFSSSYNIFAIRGEYSWQQKFMPATLKSQATSRLKDGGRYLFTGGLGGIALTLAEHIASNVSSPVIILLSRSSFPEQAVWDDWIRKNEESDRISRRIMQLRKLVSKGATVRVVQADVSNYKGLSRCIDILRADLGNIDGMIHAAGIAGGGLAQLKTHDMAYRVLQPKVNGTYNLVKACRSMKLDFFVMCSSVASILGELSQVDYCAANACLDAFANTTLFNEKTYIAAINWNTWKEVGMAVETERPGDVSYFDRDNDISPEEGKQIFSKIVNSSQNQVIVSTFDVNSLIKMVHQGHEYNRQTPAVKRDTINVNTDYKPPRTRVEKQFAEIWERTLGIEQVGIDDGFFELGGHSLLALRMLTEIKNTVGMNVSLSQLYDHPTIMSLARTLQVADKDETGYQDILVKLKSCSSPTTIFFIHPVSGMVTPFMQLINSLSFPCSVYGIQDSSIEKGKLICKSIEEYAMGYLSAIRSVQKKGPYYLCGLSFGATVAFEITKQLLVAGQEVNALVMLDGWAIFSKEQHDENLFKARLRDITQQSDDLFVNLAWQRMGLLLQYKPTPISCVPHLFKARDLLPEYQSIDNSYNGWQPYCPDGVDLYKTPGNHETMIQDANVAILASNMSLCLKKLENTAIIDD